MPCQRGREEVVFVLGSPCEPIPSRSIPAPRCNRSCLHLTLSAVSVGRNHLTYLQLSRYYMDLSEETIVGC